MGQHPGTPEPGEPPFVDQHSLHIDASPQCVWAALQQYAAASLRIPDGNPLAVVLGTRPRAGFHPSDVRPPESLTLSGRHRFSRYRLRFDVVPADHGGAELRALTFAAFPGPHGRVYRALVIGSRGHALATRHMLRAVRRLAASPSGSDAPGQRGDVEGA